MLVQGLILEPRATRLRGAQMPNETMQAAPSFSNRSLYLQVRDHFLLRIAKGDWAAGAAIESETDLAKRLRVSAGTIRKALDQLERDGLVTRRQGRGTYINDQTSEEVLNKFSRLWNVIGVRVVGAVTQSRLEIAEATDDEQIKLQLSRKDNVYRCVRLRVYQGHVFMHERLSISQRRFPDVKEDDFLSAGVAAKVARRHGVLIGGAEERLEICDANSEMAGALNVKVGQCLLRLDRVVLCIDKRPLEWRVANCDLREKYYMNFMS
jgi:GntR family transcriptional regulator